jgi:hypothetical protein
MGKRGKEKVSKNLDVGAYEVSLNIPEPKVASRGREGLSITLHVHVLNDFISLGLFSVNCLSSEPLFFSESSMPKFFWT